jgi:hypothetical protein
MIESMLLSAALCGGVPYTPVAMDRPIATTPAYPVGMADDVRRPGFNGRLYVTRPILGVLQGDFARTVPRPELDAYGAYLTPCESVPARVGLLTISISPWHAWNEQGHRGLERARQVWLAENNYTGGVQTHVNDYFLWRELSQPTEPGHVSTPEPAAVIELAPDAPRGRSRMRVDAAPGCGSAAAAILLQQGHVRISWPHAAPGIIVARSEHHGGVKTPPVRVTARLP